MPPWSTRNGVGVLAWNFMIQRFDELKATQQLPTPIGTALEILRLSESEKTSRNEIASRLQTDPALCGRLLKITNSAGVGLGRAVTTVSEAVNHLGIRMVRNVALGFSLVSQYSKGRCSAFDYGKFWSHSLAMGIGAQACALKAGGIAPAEAFTFGLLAQIGRLAFASVYPEIYAELLTQATNEDPGDLREQEKRRFAITHNELTGAMFRDWGLPDESALAVENYGISSPTKAAQGSRTPTLMRVLETASILADICASDENERSTAIQKLEVAAHHIHLTPDEVPKLCDQVVHDWQEWGGILRIDTAIVPPFSEMIERARACARLTPIEDTDEPTSELFDRPLDIVVVDDDAVCLQGIVRQLTKAGHHVKSATRGDQGLRLILEFAPQLVITDFQMPGMNGAALTRALRRTNLGRRLYVIMLTGSNEVETQVNAFNAGADDFLLKPVDSEILAARLRLRPSSPTPGRSTSRSRGAATLPCRPRPRQSKAATSCSHGRFDRPIQPSPCLGTPGIRMG